MMPLTNDEDMDQMSHRERIVCLIHREMPEVKEIYQGTLTIFERMLLWDTIEKVDWVDKNQSSSVDAVQQCYDNFLMDVEKFISEEADPMTKMNMECFKSKMLNGQIYPQAFIQEMADMIHKENDLIKKYYFDQKPFQDSFETTLKDSRDNLMEQLKAAAESLKIQLESSLQAEKKVHVLRVHSPEGQQLLDKMKAACIQIGQICDTSFASFFSEMENAKRYLKDAKRLFQKKLSYDSMNLPMTEQALSLQALDDNFHIWTSALCSVKEDMANYENDVLQMYTKNPQGVLSDLYSKFVGYKNRLGQFLNDYLHMCVLTIKCPCNQYHKSSNSSSKKDQEETAKPKQKATKTKMDKRENSALNSTLKILGAQSFGRNFRIKPSSSTVFLVDENLLPEYLPEGTELHFQPDDIIKCGTLKPESPPKLNDGFELKFYREEIEEPSRSKSKSSKDKESTSVVVTSFSRFWYRIDVEVFDGCHSLFAVSHPIGWRTGSNQLLQFNGSLTWYHWNVDNVYENLRIPQKVPVSNLMDMLNEQISNIKDQNNSFPHKTKSRSLSSNDREFLQTMLLGENSTSEYVYLKDFICSKQGDKKKRAKNDPSQKTQTVDFHTWFFALVKSLSGFLKGLWIDCLIYGICSDKTTSEVLLREETPVGTIMLRPSTSRVHNTRSMDSCLDLALDFKTNRGNYDHVDNINWDAKNINHLPEALLTHGPTFKYIQGVNNRKWPITILKNYFSNESRHVYRSTAFRMTISFEIVGDDQEATGSPLIDEKKIKTDDLCVSDDGSCREFPPHINDNQSMIISSTQLNDPEMSPDCFHSPPTNQADFHFSGVPQMGEIVEHDENLNPLSEYMHANALDFDQLVASLSVEDVDQLQAYFPQNIQS